MTEATAPYDVATNANGKQVTFNPRDHLRFIERRQKQRDGSYKTIQTEYLDVKWRIMWFRTENPNGNIVTELLSVAGDDPAVVRATVTMADGTTTTGMGQQGHDDWSDWLEKAETRAIGRALGAMGYGTQFCEDFDDGDAIADSPVEPQPKPKHSEPKAPDNVNAKVYATKNQFGKIHATRQERGWTSDQMYARAAQINPEVMTADDTPTLRVLSKQDASQLIDALMKEQPRDIDLETGEVTERITADQVKEIHALRDQQSMSPKEVAAYASDLIGRPVTKPADMTSAEADTVIAALKEL